MLVSSCCTLLASQNAGTFPYNAQQKGTPPLGPDHNSMVIQDFNYVLELMVVTKARQPKIGCDLSKN